MGKKVLVFCAMVLGVFAVSNKSFAMMCRESKDHSEHMQIAQVSVDAHNHQEPAGVSNASGAVNVGNTTCPVLGEKIDDKTKATYEYQGKIYNFCCASCIGKFKSSPEKYIKKIENN